MQVTEEAARTKRCCVFLDRQCTASDCMAWEWVYEYNPIKQEFPQPGTGTMIKTDKGYCSRTNLRK